MMFQSGDIVVTNTSHEQDVIATVDQVMGKLLLVEVDGSLYEVSQDDTEFYVPPYRLDRFDILQVQYGA